MWPFRRSVARILRDFYNIIEELSFAVTKLEEEIDDISSEIDILLERQRFLEARKTYASDLVTKLRGLA